MYMVPTYNWDLFIYLINYLFVCLLWGKAPELYQVQDNL